MANSLGLDDDLDGVDLVRDIEAAFELRIPGKDAERMKVVGDLHDWLVENIDPNSTGPKCASAMVFFRLRHALRRLGFEDELTPTSKLDFLEGRNLKANLADLERETGLQLPKAASTRVTGIAYIVTAILLVVALSNMTLLERTSMFVPSLILVGLIGWKIYALDPGKFPRNCSTLGELAKTVASRNFGRLAKLGARHGPEEIWETLLDLLPTWVLPRSEITRETYFLQSQLENRRTF